MTDVDFVTMMNSTIVRSQQATTMPLMRAAGRALSALAPLLAARLAERLFLTPPRHRRPAVEIALLEQAAARPLMVGGRRIEMWKWGRGPVVLLVHGWGGRGTQLGAFVPPLVARGFSVVTFDAPGHGAAEPGLVTIPDMTAALRAVAATQRPLAGLIAHSLGATVATRALYEGLEAASVVFIAPSAEVVGPATWFAHSFGLSPRASELMRERVEQRVGKPFSAFDVAALAPALGMPLLVAHDRGDVEVPWQHGRIVAREWGGGAELLTTDGLGHRRILRDAGVAGTAAAFIAARAEARGLPLAPAAA
jgi:pimeloyl-ACP methyl ester carboxylesterase